MKKLLSHKSILIISIAVICCNLVLLLFSVNSDTRAASKIKVIFPEDDETTRATFKEYRKAYRKLGYLIDENIFKSIESYKEELWCDTEGGNLTRRIEFPNGHNIHVFYQNPQQGGDSVYYYSDVEELQEIPIEDLSDKLLEVMSYEKEEN